jgi:hypothetical protein
VTKKTDWDGVELLTGPGPQRVQVWEPRWWQLGRWLHWWKFRRYHGYVNLLVGGPGSFSGGNLYNLRLRVVPSRRPDAAEGTEP